MRIWDSRAFSPRSTCAYPLDGLVGVLAEFLGDASEVISAFGGVGLVGAIELEQIMLAFIDPVELHRSACPRACCSMPAPRPGFNPPPRFLPCSAPPCPPSPTARWL